MSIDDFVTVLKGESEIHSIFIKCTELVYFKKNRGDFSRKVCYTIHNPKKQRIIPLYGM